jgi:hypothetical protein
VDGLFEGISGNRRVQEILICWTAPLLIASLAFVIVVLPDVRHAAPVASVAAAVATLHVNKFLFVFVACLVLATFLQANRLPLWRVLEGYAWPKFLRRWRVLRAHVPQCRWLQACLFHERAQVQAEQAQAQLARAEQSAAGDADLRHLREATTQAQDVTARWGDIVTKADRARHNRDRGRKYPSGLAWLPRSRQPLLTYGRPAESQLGRWTLPYPGPTDSVLPYPDSPKFHSASAVTQIMPTLLGNAMRVMETYGANNYGLDSQIMWFELVAEAPASIQDTLVAAQFEADTLVCGIYATAALACTALAGGVWLAIAGGTDAKLWVTAAVSSVVAVILYRRLLNCVDGWASATRALVNGARGRLLEKYGLRTPSSAEDEKRMWEALTATFWYGFDEERERQLAKYKQPAPDGFRPLRNMLHWLEAHSPERDDS